MAVTMHFRILHFAKKREKRWQ